MHSQKLSKFNSWSSETHPDRQQQEDQAPVEPPEAVGSIPLIEGFQALQNVPGMQLVDGQQHLKGLSDAATALPWC